MIELREHSVTFEDYSRLAFLYVRNLHVVFLAFGCAFFFSDGFPMDWGEWLAFAIFFVVGFGVMLYFPVYWIMRYQFSFPGNKAVFQKRKITFGDGEYRVLREDGTETRGRLKHIVFAESVGDYYLLYLRNFLGPVSYLTVPRSAFSSEEDRTFFEKKILGWRLAGWRKKLAFVLFITVFIFGMNYAVREHVFSGGKTECPDVHSTFHSP